MMVRRVYVEKREGLRQEAEELLREGRSVLGIASLTGIRVLNRYDVEGLDGDGFARSIRTVFSEPQVDWTGDAIPPELLKEAAHVFAVEALPGQFDQRADSAESCIQLITQGERPCVRTAKVYLLFGAVSDAEAERVKRYVINPVESREADMGEAETLSVPWEEPPMVETIRGFRELDGEGLSALLNRMGLAMDGEDLRFLQAYFREEEYRDPTVTEIRVVDTYWSDHCRHTTFSTHLDRVEIQDSEVQNAYGQYLAARTEAFGRDAARKRPQTLMDIATIGARVLKKRGLLDNLDESEEVNACSIHVTATVNGEAQDWLLMFKNETHNHPTEIEPFGGAATCIGGCIRDPLSGRAYVCQAMRVTGCGDPRVPVSSTIPGKLPQRKIAQTAAAGYASYGNQIGLATGLVSEVYHPGYVAKHMEVGAVVGAAPSNHVVRLRPVPGDVVILVGGRTGRDGIGGATGASKSHDSKSLSTMASEVQKGNAPEERKLQRLFRNPAASRMIKRCNDFGAGGVSVAIGELADGLEINLDAVRRKYEGLDGTELAISESQERMAVVVSPSDTEAFLRLADGENLEAYPVAVVTESPRMVMRWRGGIIVNLSRAFLNTNGAEKHTTVCVPWDSCAESPRIVPDLRAVAASLDCASRRGLAERFDASIGAGSVLMPFGGKYQRTPAQVMAALLPVLPGQETEDCSVMSWGFDPFRMEANPFAGARESVVLSVAKLVAAGCDYHRAYLTFQEYFEKLRTDPERWGRPFAALLGALDAQLHLNVAAIGGKDSMSGSFLEMDVPPTLISFAIAPSRAGAVLSPEFKEAGHPVYLFGSAAISGSGDRAGGTADPDTGSRRKRQSSPDWEALKKDWEAFHRLCGEGKVCAAWAVNAGIAEAVMQMSFGNEIGFRMDVEKTASGKPVLLPDWYTPLPGVIVAELTENTLYGVRIGVTTEEAVVDLSKDGGPRNRVPIAELLALNEGVLESVYPNRAAAPDSDVPCITTKPANAAASQSAASASDPVSPQDNRTSPPDRVPHSDEPLPGSRSIGKAVPHVLIPVFPGTNCEYDSQRAVLRAGLDAEVFVINNLTARKAAESAERFAASVAKSQIVFLPGGFSGGDEPDGSAKFITAFFRNPRVTDAVMELLRNRDGLMLGICNGFQALIKLGLVPFGEIRDMDDTCPTLTGNVIGRHQSRMVQTRIASNRSPWLSHVQPGDIVTVPISHGEGRFLCPPSLLETLRGRGQIATQYADLEGVPSMDVRYNPNGSQWAVEGLLSPDGRIFGKMGHAERTGSALYRNVPGNYGLHLFDAAREYYG